jgi:hypothetical protein
MPPDAPKLVNGPRLVINSSGEDQLRLVPVHPCPDKFQLEAALVLINSYVECMHGGKEMGPLTVVLGASLRRAGLSAAKPSRMATLISKRLFALNRGALPGQWVHAACRAALVSRIRA